MSTHNLCFRAKIRKMYTPVNPSFTILKWGTRGYTLHGLVIMMTRTTVKFLNFETPENFAVIHLKFKKRGKNFQYFVKNIQTELQTVKTLIRLLLKAV